METTRMLEQVLIALPVMWPPMAVAGAIMLVAWWPRVRKSHGASDPDSRLATRAWGNQSAAAALVTSHRGTAGALAMGLAFVTAFLIVIGGMPPLPLIERWHWLLPMGVAATITGAIAGAVARTPSSQVVFGVITAAALGILLQPPSAVVYPHIVRVVGAVLTLIAWWCLNGSARAHRGFLTPLLLSITFTGVSVIALHGYDANISLLSTAMAAVLAGVAVLALFLPPLSLCNGATHVLATLLVGLLAIAWMYDAGNKVAISLLSATPLLVRAGEMATARLSPWVQAIVRLVCVLTPVIVAIVLARSGAAQ